MLETIANAIIHLVIIVWGVIAIGVAVGAVYIMARDWIEVYRDRYGWYK